MPTYTVTAPKKQLSTEQKARIAKVITETHCAATGAPAAFAQVIFVETKPGNYYIGGAPLDAKHVFVHGCIRAGRSAAVKEKLLVGLLEAVAKVTALARNQVWVYVSDLAPRQMAEFGHVLPKPGDEKAWTAALPPADRVRMQTVGHAHGK